MYMCSMSHISTKKQITNDSIYADVADTAAGCYAIPKASADLRDVSLHLCISISIRVIPSPPPLSFLLSHCPLVPC